MKFFIHKSPCVFPTLMVKSFYTIKLRYVMTRLSKVENVFYQHFTYNDLFLSKEGRVLYPSLVSVYLTPGRHLNPFPLFDNRVPD